MYQSWDEHGGYDFMLKNRKDQAQTVASSPGQREYGYEDHTARLGENRKAPAAPRKPRPTRLGDVLPAAIKRPRTSRPWHGLGPDTGGGWINGRGDDEMTCSELYGHIHDFFTATLVDVAARAGPGCFVPAAAKAAVPDSRAARKALAARNAEGDLAVVYVPGGGVVSLNGELLKDGLRPLWFSPRDAASASRVPSGPKRIAHPTPATGCCCSARVQLFLREYDDEFEQ